MASCGERIFTRSRSTWSIRSPNQARRWCRRCNRLASGAPRIGRSSKRDPRRLHRQRHPPVRNRLRELGKLPDRAEELLVLVFEKIADQAIVEPFAERGVALEHAAEGEAGIVKGVDEAAHVFHRAAELIAVI